MDARALLQHQLAVSHQTVQRSLDGISDDEARKTPDDLAPIVWQVGHIALGNFGFARGNLNFVLGPEAAPAGIMPGDSAALFKTGTGGTAPYPPLADVVKSLDLSQDALSRAIAEADLAAPYGGPFWKTQTEAYAFAVAHRWYHIGKINTLRALLRKPRLFG